MQLSPACVLPWPETWTYKTDHTMAMTHKRPARIFRSLILVSGQCLVVSESWREQLLPELSLPVTRRKSLSLWARGASHSPAVAKLPRPSEHRTVVARNEVKQLRCGSQTPLSRIDSVALCERFCLLQWYWALLRFDLIESQKKNTDDVYIVFHCLVLNKIDVCLIPLSVDTPSIPKK